MPGEPVSDTKTTNATILNHGHTPRMAPGRTAILTVAG